MRSLKLSNIRMFLKLANLVLYSRLALFHLFFHVFSPLIFPLRNLRHGDCGVDAHDHTYNMEIR